MMAEVQIAMQQTPRAQLSSISPICVPDASDFDTSAFDVLVLHGTLFPPQIKAMMNKPAVGAKRVASQRVASQTMIAKRVRLASDAACLAPPPCALQQPAQQSYDEVRCEALQPPSRGGPGMHGMTSTVCDAALFCWPPPST